MPRHKKKEYFSDLVMMEMLKLVSDEYMRTKSVDGVGSLSSVAADFSMSRLKVRKLLITAGVYTSDVCTRVNELYGAGKEIQEIQAILHISRASVHSYLPYNKIVYNAKELSTNAERIRLYRNRQAAVNRLQDALVNAQSFEILQDILWETMISFQDYPFQTKNGLKYKYKVMDHELVIGRDQICISRCSLNTIFADALGMNEETSKAKNVAILEFETDFIFPILIRVGVLSDA